jgi:hypothetical protein
MKNYRYYFFGIACMLLFNLFSYGTNRKHTMFTDSTFKEWAFSNDSVFGIVHLLKTKSREYVKISRVNASLYIVSKYNAANILINTTKVKLLNGSINLLTETDQWGNLYDSTWFRPLNHGVLLATRRTHGEKENTQCKYEQLIFKDNLLVEKRCLLDTGHLCNNAEGVAIYKYKRYQDEKRFSLVHEITYYNAQEKPVYSKSSGCAKLINEFDENGNQVSAALYGFNDEPVENRLGVFMLKAQFDNNGNLNEEDCFNASGKLVKNAFGYAKVKMEYKDGFVIRQAIYDENDHVTRADGTRDVVAIYKNEYDKSGNIIRKSFYNIYETPAVNHAGVNSIVYKYSASGMLKDIFNYTISPFKPQEGLKPDNDRAGASHYHYERDNKGRMISCSQFDKLNFPVKDNTDKAYITRYEYDNWGSITSTSYWENETVAMNAAEGYHRCTSVYNENGEVVVNNYFDKDEQPARGKLGYTREKIKYNNAGQVEERKFFDGDSTTVVSSRNSYSSNFHSMRYFYDENNQVESIEFFNESGVSADASIRLDNDMAFTAHKVTFRYENGRLKTERFYLTGSEASALVIDCQKSYSLPVTGIGLRKKINN